jgi:hypothetical protein
MTADDRALVWPLRRILLLDSHKWGDPERNEHPGNDRASCVLAFMTLADVLAQHARCRWR